MCKTGHCIFRVLIALLGVAQTFGKVSVSDLKVWQRYVDNEQLFATKRIMSDNGFSLTAVIHGLYNLTRYYSTCRNQAIQFDYTLAYHFIWTVCSDLQVHVLSSTNIVSHTLEIKLPTALGINITVLKFHSDHYPVRCTDKRMVVGSGVGYGDDICGNPYLGRSSIIPNYTTHVFFVYRHHMETVLNISLHIQAIAFAGRHKDVSRHVEGRIFPPILQLFKGRYYVTGVISLTALVNSVEIDQGVNVGNFVAGVRISSSYCSPDVFDILAMYDGPYAGVLSTRGLMSPFQLLMEGSCLDVPTDGYLSYNASIGDLTVVLRHSLHNYTSLNFQFYLDLPAQCPGVSCRRTTVEVAHERVQMWSSILPPQPLIQFYN